VHTNGEQLRTQSVYTETVADNAASGRCSFNSLCMFVAVALSLVAQAQVAASSLGCAGCCSTEDADVEPRASSASFPGYCGAHNLTDEAAPPVCGATGFGARLKGVASLEQCIERCRGCAAGQCRYASYSQRVRGGDCSLYSRCDVTALRPHADYEVVDVLQEQPAKRCEIWANSLALPPAPCPWPRWASGPQNCTTCRQLLVTGSGGSGSHSISSELRRLMLDVPHEGLGRDGAVGWPYAVQANAYPWGATPNSPFRRVVQLVRCPIDAISSFLSHRRKSWDFIAKRCPSPGFRDTLTDLMANITAAMQRRGQSIQHAPMMPRNGSLGSDEMSQLIAFAVNAWLCWNGHVESYATGRVALERLDMRELCLLGGFGAQRCPTQSTPISTGARLALEEELQKAHATRRALSPANPSNHRKHPALAFEEISRTVGPTVSRQLLNMSRRYGYELLDSEEKCRLRPEGNTST
jgi:hypothetical protein